LQGGKTLEAKILRQLSTEKVRLLHGWLAFQRCLRQPESSSSLQERLNDLKSVQNRVGLEPNRKLNFY
jgi:hypothetical protein